MRTTSRNGQRSSGTISVDPDHTLKGAVEDIAPTIDRHGEAHAKTWTDIEKSFRRELMEEGNEIALKTYEASYLSSYWWH